MEYKEKEYDNLFLSLTASKFNELEKIKKEEEPLKSIIEKAETKLIIRMEDIMTKINNIWIKKYRSLPISFALVDWGKFPVDITYHYIKLNKKENLLYLSFFRFNPFINDIPFNRDSMAINRYKLIYNYKIPKDFYDKNFTKNIINNFCKQCENILKKSKIDIKKHKLLEISKLEKELEKLRKEVN